MLFRSDFHFRKGEQRFDINRTWICLKSKTLPRVRAPWRDWAELKNSDGSPIVTPVDDVSIHPRLLAAHIQEMGRRYNIRMIAMDSFRWTVVSDALRAIGFDASDKERVKLVRPADIMRTDPTIQQCFDRGYFAWGNNPCLRWAVNNTKRLRRGRSEGTDTGNYYYAKIDAKARKTDPFMALVAAVTAESVLGTGEPPKPPPIGAIVL